MNPATPSRPARARAAGGSGSITPARRPASTLGSPPPVQRTGVRRPPFDVGLAVAVAGICVCSLVTLHTVSQRGLPPDYYMKRQAVYFGIGAALAIALARLDYSRLRELRYGIVLFIVASVLAVMVFGSDALGARRSIQLPFFSFQASELGKVLLVVALSGLVAERARSVNQVGNTVRILGVALVPMLLVLVQPDLGSSMVYAAIATAVLAVGGAPGRHFAGLGALAGLVVVVVLVLAPAAGVEILHGYQTDRLTAFLHPNDNTSEIAYQQTQSRVAIGSGEKTGRGDRATQTSYNFLPEHHTDFIFAVVGERWGFMGAALVLSLYALLVWRGLRCVMVARNLFGAVLAGGITAMLLFQVFVNVGMTIGIMPITGIPLPMSSYGGSSVLSTFIAVGLLQSVYVHDRRSARGARTLAF